MADSPQTSTRRYREYDDIFQHVRSFGRYQKIMYFCFNLVIFPMASQFGALVFAVGSPLFHCTTPNVTCPSFKCCDNCTSYVFDGPFTSTVSEWNLICDRAYLGATLQASYFAGMLIGSFATGIISDTWGRKFTMFSCYGIMLVAGVSSSFVDCISFFGFLRFLVGFGLTGMMLSQYIYCIELVGPKRRTFVGTCFGVYWNGMNVVFVMLAYFIREWRTLLLVVTLPAALVFLFWKVIPESPRWLVSHGRLDEAVTVIMKYGGKKNKPVDPVTLRTVIEEVRRDQIEREQEARKYTPIDLIRTPKMRKLTLTICFNWFVVSFVSFAMLLYVNRLAGSIYLNYGIMRTMAIVKLPLVWILLLKIGRRLTHGGSMAIAAICCILIIAVANAQTMVSTAISLLGFMFVSSNWATIYLMTSEIYPTVLRNTAQGTGSTSSRIGAILAPYLATIGQLPHITMALPFSIFAALALSACISTYWIPETLYATMHQTIEEAEAAKDDYGIPCCRKPPEAEPQETTDPLI